jgi:predicted transcriptional regulator
MRRRSRGDLEQQVFAVLAEAGRAMSTAEVREVLQADLAYTTVMTVLVRMYAKGTVTRDRVGRSYVYTAVVDEAEVAARQIDRLLSARDDRAAVLARFVGGLSAEDSRLLVDLLRAGDDDDSDDDDDNDENGRG